MAAAPLKGLGLAFGAAGSLVGGGDGISLDEVAFEPGSSEVPDAGHEFVAILATALRQRPEFHAVLHGSTGGDDDIPLAAQILLERIEADDPPAGYAERGLLDRRRMRDGLEAFARNRPSELEGEDAELASKWFADLQVPGERRDALAEARAGALREALLDAPDVAAERVRAGPNRSGTVGVVPKLVTAGG